MDMTCSETSETVKVECPDYVNRICHYAGCPRFLSRVSKDHIDDNGQQLYRGACMLNGDVEWFDNCEPYMYSAEDKSQRVIKQRPASNRKRGRKGSGLKGNRTKRMLEQLENFKAWLRDNPVNERISTRTVGARSRTYWLQHNKTMTKDSKRTGEKRGFSSYKTLAAAYRNS